MIGIINVLYNNDEAELRQHYQELRKQFGDVAEYRSFIIDNSQSGQRHLVPEGAAYSHFPQNLGYTGACNLLMAQAFEAGCRAVVTMNVDGFPLPNCIASMLETLARHDGDALVEARQFPQEHPRAYDPVTGATDWVSGCCLLVGRRSYERLGPFDEGMFLYCEDVDYSFRARLAGIPCVVSTGAHFYHRGPTPPFDRNKRKQHLISSRYLSIKWQSLETQRIMEDALVSEGFYASASDLPPVPAQIRTYPGVQWNPKDLLGFAPMRWHP